MKQTGMIFLVAALVTSCGSETESTQQNVSGTDSTVTAGTTEDTEEEVQSRFQYDVEWEAFKDAVYGDDLEAIKLFVTDEVMDAEMLLSALKEDWVVDELKKTSYEDLGDSDFNGTYVKEFSASVSGSDAEGTIYESGIFLYFEEGMEGLKLVNVLMAG